MALWSVRPIENHLKVLSLEIPQPSIIKISFKITWCQWVIYGMYLILKAHSRSPGLDTTNRKDIERHAAHSIVKVRNCSTLWLYSVSNSIAFWFFLQLLMIFRAQFSDFWHLHCLNNLFPARGVRNVSPAHATHAIIVWYYSTWKYNAVFTLKVLRTQSQYKEDFPGYRDLHVNDKTVARPSYL